MGLDMNLYKVRKIKFPITFNNYTDYNIFSDEYAYRQELMYWRKKYDINDMIGNIIGHPVENCEFYSLTKEQLEKLIEDLTYVYQEDELSDCDDENVKAEFEDYKKALSLDIQELQKIVEETDFEMYDIIYEADW